MKTKTEKILTVLNIFAWIAMIGYAIECGSQLISVIVSCTNSAAAKKIPGINQDLLGLLQYNFKFYIFFMSFIIALSAMKVQTWYLVIELLSKLNLRTPFSTEVTKYLERIAYQLFGIWIVSVIGKGYISWLSKRMDEDLNIINIADEFLFVAGIVYIISQIFKRGIEIQEENQLTV